MCRWASGALWLSATLALSACGSEADPASDAAQGQSVSQTSIQALCAGAGVQRSANIVTRAACPFEQQYANILRYGEAMDPEEIHDASGTDMGAATQSCDTWLLVTDPDGVDVLIDSSSGAVRSHGMLHPGQPLSRLPEQLVLPFALQAQ